MEVIARYKEQRFDGMRTFELFLDRVVVRGKHSLGSEFETTLMLATLQPTVSTVRTRTKGFGQGIAGALVAIVLLQGGLVTPQSYWGELDIGMIISGALLALATARKVTWAQFHSRAGVIALTVARAGKQEAGFEPFVQALLGQIPKE